MTVLTDYLNTVILGLTPLERLDAIRDYKGHSVDSRWFTWIGVVIVAALLVLLATRIYKRQKSSQNRSGREFDDYARSKGVTDREYRLLVTMAANAELVRSEFIFTLPSAFDRQAARLVEQVRTEQGVEQSQHFERELTLLREKLGFKRYTSPEVNLTSDIKVQSTRQIPPKRKFHIKYSRESKDGLEAVLLKNTPNGLFVQFMTPVEIVFGQTWICRYFAGTYIAEFHTTVAKCSGRVVVLNHSNHVRLINRRRFLRVEMDAPAYVAEFPFQRTPGARDLQSPRKRVDQSRSSGETENEFEFPRFVPATVTELGGPGLRIRTELKLHAADRVLIMFKLGTQSGGHQFFGHLGKVKHIVYEDQTPSVAIELTGLNEDAVNELIRATSDASLEMNKWRRNSSNTEHYDIWTEEVASV